MAERSYTLPKNLLTYLQVGKNPRALEETTALWKKAHELSDVYTWRAHMPMEEFVSRFHPYASASKAITRLFTGAHEVWLMAATIGEALETRSREYLAQHDVFRGYILDRMGSFMVEDEIRKSDEKISLECERRGYSTTRRYSPGYQDFSIEAQKIYLEMIGSAIPGLKLSPGWLLKPEKTITALKGVIRV